MTPDEVEAMFTRSDGQFAFARWARPVAPVIFGLADEAMPAVKGALELVAAVAGRGLAETDPELGANFLVFFLQDWDELRGVPGIDDLLPDLPGLLERLSAAEAARYRSFRFEPSGAIKAHFSFLRLDAATRALPAEAVGLSLALQGMLLWSDTAFDSSSPLAELPDDGGTILRPEIANLLRAAYDPVLPDTGSDPALALRLQARASLGVGAVPQ
ncbi:hypothetical protein [Frigidibacter sp. ROC022]|uniref:hypothetical protein n=1 Tax=Frigidibacter sp. ROC022 TaxID=2971796 RepID=UPI00215A54E3|nr:hypothetical protein [Frigidibacter sp. ROC022]MCR8725135.1 hypothetical protein [Frigidibacter sp. ROC022]